MQSVSTGRKLIVEDYTDEELMDIKRLEDLKNELDACHARCASLEQAIVNIENFNIRRNIENVTLPPGSKLIDLLIERILDTDNETWKSKIDTLINIPHSLPGEGLLLGGDYFEALFQLAIAIGILPQFRDQEVTFYDIHDYTNLVVFNNYLYEKDILNRGGGEQGISDITFELGTSNVQTNAYKCGEETKPVSTTTDNPFYFVTVKGYKTEKSVKDAYDVPLLDKQITLFPEKPNKHIIVCVRNKQAFMKRLTRTRIEFLKSSINHVIGYDEVIDAFASFRTNFFTSLEKVDRQSIINRVSELFPVNKTYKPFLTLYFHQELIVKSTVARIQPSPTKPQFLCIGVLPRGGKSFIAGGIISAHKQKLQKESGYNVLFLTSAINETREQFERDLITKFSDFDNFEFIDVVNMKKKTLEQSTKPNKFIFVSRQLSSIADDQEFDKSSLNDSSFIKRLESVLKNNKLTFDICFFDEAHIGIGSERVKEQFQKTFQRFRMPIVLMTATYRYPAQVLENDNDLFIWDLQDVKDMKTLAVSKKEDFLDREPDFMQRYPLAKDILMNRFRLGETEAQIAKPYINFPNPNFISLTFAPQDIARGVEYDFLKAFQTTTGSELLKDNDRYQEWGTLLKMEARDQAMRLRDFLTPEESQTENETMTGRNRKYRALNQIFKIAQQTNSRPVLGKPFSMIMFLPFGPGLAPIGELCRIWASFFLEHRYWRDNFVMMTISRYSNHVRNTLTLEQSIQRGIVHIEDVEGSLKDAILKVEKAALAVGKGLVLLSGDVAKMGISLKCVDIVCLMSTNTEADDIIQKIYRALTDDPPAKKNGFIIDLDLKRIVTAMFEYDIEKDRRKPVSKQLNMNDRIERLMELCNWGQDAFIEDNQTRNFNDVMDDIRNRIFSDLRAKKQSEYSDKTLAQKQFQLIRDNENLYTQVVDVIRFTSFGKKQKKKVTLLARNPDIATETSTSTGIQGESDQQVEPEPEPEPEPQPQGLSEEEIKKKMVNMFITFINALVIKSDIPWSSDLSYETLLERYKQDKLQRGPNDEINCTCDEESTTTNLYDIAYCELNGYAMKQSGESYVYDPDTHKQIMELMDRIFLESLQLAPDWSLYIDTLIQELTSM